MRLSHLTEKENDLFLACMRGNENDVEELLNEGVSANFSCDNVGNSILMFACSYNKEAIVNVLLKHGANVNAKGNYGETALIVASRVLHNNNEIIKLLIKHGANVNEKNGVNKTALISACESKKYLTAKLLIENGADIDVVDNFGKTALKYACENRDIVIVRELLKRSAYISNLSDFEIRFIKDNIKDCSTIGAIEAIVSRDNKNLDNYLNDCCRNRSKDVDFLSNDDKQIKLYKDYFVDYYITKQYLKSLKNTKELRELRNETKELKEYIANVKKAGNEQIDIKKEETKLEKNIKVLKAIRKFEDNISDILNINVLKPIYYKKTNHTIKKELQ